MKLSARAGLITGILLLAVVIAVATHFGKPEEFAKLIKQAKPLWLLVGVALQVATYVCAGGVWSRALVRQGHSRSLFELTRLGVVKLFMDQAVPSAGISGNVMVGRALGRRGLSHQSAVATVLAGLISFYIAYALAASAALLILWLTSHVSRFIMILVTIFAVLLGLLLWALLWVTRGNRDRVPRRIRNITSVKKFLGGIGDHPPHVLRDAVFFLEGTALQLLLIALDAATLWAILQSLGTTASPAGVFAAFTMASVVAMISLLPAGLGTFDGTAIALLRAFQVPFEAAVAATVLLRGLTFILPLVPGFFLVRHEAVK